MAISCRTIWSLCLRHCQSTKYTCWIKMGNLLTMSTVQPFHALHVLRSPYEAPIHATKYACWTAPDHLLTMSTVQPLHGLHVIRSPYEAPLDKTRMLTLYAATFIFLPHTSTSFILHHILQNTYTEVTSRIYFPVRTKHPFIQEERLPSMLLLLSNDSHLKAYGETNLRITYYTAQYLQQSVRSTHRLPCAPLHAMQCMHTDTPLQLSTRSSA